MEEERGVGMEEGEVEAEMRGEEVVVETAKKGIEEVEVGTEKGIEAEAMTGRGIKAEKGIKEIKEEDPQMKHQMMSWMPMNQNWGR